MDGSAAGLTPPGRVIRQARSAIIFHPSYCIYSASVLLIDFFGDTSYYRQTSNMRRTLVGNKVVDHSNVVGALPVGAAPSTSSFST